MAASKVYFTDLRATFRENLLAKLVILLKRAGLEGIIEPQGIVAIKLHFGERGNTAFIRPNFVRRVVESVKELGGRPFLTDTNTLYTGTRMDSVSHLNVAVENGFSYSVVNAPVIIADGIRGSSHVEVTVNKNIFKSVFIGKEIHESDVLISLAHFKGHDLAGFGGTLKNIGMGCASRKGKLIQHSDLSPKIKRKKCIGCGDCIKYCPRGALSMRNEKAEIDSKKCIGCGECIIICPNSAIDVRWNRDSALFQKKMVEYACGALQGKEGKSVFLNFLLQISPACDCAPYNDAPIVRDLGIMASRDPVAIDQASVDLVNSQVALDGSCLKSQRNAGDDKFRGVYPMIDWSIQLDYGEELGLGNRSYELVNITQ